MELNQDFRLVQQLMFEFDDPYEYEMQFIGGGTCSVTDELDDVPAIVNATSATVSSLCEVFRDSNSLRHLLLVEVH